MTQMSTPIGPEEYFVWTAYHDGTRGWPPTICAPDFPDAIRYVRADIADARIEAARREGREEAAAEMDRLAGLSRSAIVFQACAAQIRALNAPKSEPPV